MASSSVNLYPVCKSQITTLCPICRSQTAILCPVRGLRIALFAPSVWVTRKCMHFLSVSVVHGFVTFYPCAKNANLDKCFQTLLKASELKLSAYHFYDVPRFPLDKTGLFGVLACVLLRSFCFVSFVRLSVSFFPSVCFPLQSCKLQN